MRSRRRRRDSIDAAEFAAGVGMLEQELQDQVIEAARYAGFDLIFHDKDSRMNEPGFPDLIMLHRSGRMVVIELKREGEEPRPEQWNWLRRFAEMRDLIHGPFERDPVLDDHPVVQVYVIRPKDRDWLFQELGEYGRY